MQTTTVLRSVRLPSDVDNRVVAYAKANRCPYTRAVIDILSENLAGPSWRGIDQIAADLRVAAERQHALNLTGDLLRAVDALLGALGRSEPQQIEQAIIDTRKTVDVINLEAQRDLRRVRTTGKR
jgi:hypothetical protein